MQRYVWVRNHPSIMEMIVAVCMRGQAMQDEDVPCFCFNSDKLFAILGVGADGLGVDRGVETFRMIIQDFDNAYCVSLVPVLLRATI